MSNDNMSPQMKELSVRTSAAFMLFDLLARVLDERGILTRDELADDIAEIVKERQAQLRHIQRTGGPDLAAFGDALAVIENFTGSDMRQP